MVTAGMTPRDAVRQLEARLTAAGCPDADYDAAELFRLVTGRDEDGYGFGEEWQVYLFCKP